MVNMKWLFLKEWRTLWRNYKWIWLPAVISLLSIMQPISSFYMEDIMKLSGSLPEGAIFKIPVPTAEEVMASVLSQNNSIGILLFIVATMGAVADERKNGSLVFLLTRPVATFHIIGSKLVAYCLLAILSVTFGFLLSGYYTSVLFGDLNWDYALLGLLVYLLFVCFVVAVILACSSIFLNNATVAMVSAVVLGALMIAGGWFSVPLAWLPTQLSDYAVSMITEGSMPSGFTGCLLVTLIAIILLLFAASYALKRNINA